MSNQPIFVIQRNTLQQYVDELPEIMTGTTWGCLTGRDDLLKRLEPLMNDEEVLVSQVMEHLNSALTHKLSPTANKSIHRMKKFILQYRTNKSSR